MPHKRYLSLRELSTTTGLSEATIRRRCRRGQLPVCQPGGPGTKLLFPADAVEQTTNKPDAPSPLPATPPTIPGPPPRWRCGPRHGHTPNR